MANIPFLHSRRLADGRWTHHWKPSPRLRKAGWTNRLLGTTSTKTPTGALVEAANTLNQQVADWDRGAAAVATAQPVPRKWLFSDLVDAYRASPAYLTDIQPATRKEYDSRIRQLAYWAQDGALPIRSIEPDMVRDLKKALLAPSPRAAEGGRTEMVPGSKFKCAAMLRVLRLLLRWAVAERLLPVDPTDGVPIPTPPSRKSLLSWRDLCDMAAMEAVDATGIRALRFAFWTMQRREDLRLLNRFQWRELHGTDPRDRPALVNGKGEVWGFRVLQHKTGAEVDCPMPPFLHDEIEAAFKASQWLFPHSADPAKPISGDVIRRRAKPVLEAGGFAGHQLRDMRRSGMSWVCDMGAEKGDVFAISGHPLDGQQRTMADVYMPPNTKKACRAIAAACRTLATIEARDGAQLEDRT